MKLEEAWNSRYRRMIDAGKKYSRKKCFFENAAICHSIHLSAVMLNHFFNQHHPFSLIFYFVQCLGVFVTHMSYMGVNKSKANIRDQSEKRLGAARDLLFATSHRPANTVTYYSKIDCDTFVREFSRACATYI